MQPLRQIKQSDKTNRKERKKRKGGGWRKGRMFVGNEESTRTKRRMRQRGE